MTFDQNPETMTIKTRPELTQQRSDASSSPVEDCLAPQYVCYNNESQLIHCNFIAAAALCFDSICYVHPLLDNGNNNTWIICNSSSGNASCDQH